MITHPLAGNPTDDPFFGNANPLSEKPDSAQEAQLRAHISGFVADLVDLDLPDSRRVGALRHIVGCDPARALMALVGLLIGALEPEGLDELPAIIRVAVQEAQARSTAA